MDKLEFLANKYETASFTDTDPSQFLRWYGKSAASSTATTADVECAAFIAAMLSFGSRTQFIPKIKCILELADKTSGTISAWLLAGTPGFGSGNAKFYRFYSYDDMRFLFESMAAILHQSGSLGTFFQKQIEDVDKTKKSLQPHLADIISAAFPNASIVPKGRNSANKRIHMFLRWMVRTNSPVDLGLWTWYSPADLLIPLDVHVMQEAINLGLLPANARATRRTAEKLTEELTKIFPGDPTRADFALFGLGVDSNK